MHTVFWKETVQVGVNLETQGIVDRLKQSGSKCEKMGESVMDSSGSGYRIVTGYFELGKRIYRLGEQSLSPQERFCSMDYLFMCFHTVAC
jgi:hypothetical protein